MNAHYVRALAIAGVALLAACSGGSMNQTLPGVGANPAAAPAMHVAGNNTRAACPDIPAPGYARCLALIRTDVTALR
ncbi:MAG: hypothetical protein WB615_09085, partial [Candidatus Tumulicola sp.]